MNIMSGNMASSVGLPRDASKIFHSSAPDGDYTSGYPEMLAAPATTTQNNNSKGYLEAPRAAAGAAGAEDATQDNSPNSLSTTPDVPKDGLTYSTSVDYPNDDNVDAMEEDEFHLPPGVPTAAAKAIQYSNSSAASPTLSTACAPLNPVTSYESAAAADTIQFNIASRDSLSLPFDKSCVFVAPVNTTQVNNTLITRTAFSKNRTTQILETSVVFMGNPGVGKSALLNALGGNFTSGYSEVSGLTRNVTNQQATAHGRSLRLFDVPGIYDCAKDGGMDTTVKHLQMLQETLNTGGRFVLFFVISPRNGRVEPTDYLIMKTVLDSLKKAPEVGMILTQVRKKHLPLVQTKEYWDMLLKPLQTIDKSQESRHRQFLSTRSPLVLASHGEEGFREKERSRIMKYVLSFPPQPVVARDMVDMMAKQYSDMLKQGMSGEPHSEDF
ncbi:hypothetical protein BGX33_002296 [Mortierella sp. NVP41]|nr:hypothetical protein BGX33_002296 [Mortierella sp. NVP41]